MTQESSELISFAVRNQRLLDGLKAQASSDFQPTLRRLDREIRARINGDGDDIGTRKRLNKLLSDITVIQSRIYSDYNAELLAGLADLAIDQAKFEADSYTRVDLDTSPKLPPRTALIRAFNVNPLQVENYAGDPLLQPFIKNSTAKDIQRINTAIQQGFSQGLTNSQIITGIRGTKAQRFRDGQLNKVNNSNKALVRTAIQHVSTQARAATMAENSDIIKGYKIVVTFDSRTTNLCMSIGQLDETYQIGVGPMPPLHIGCRDTITPVISSEFDFLKEGATRASKGADGGEQVDAKLGSYDWLKTQPKGFQDAAIGPARAALIRDGGITSTEYAKLSLSTTFEPLTLKEMQALRPEVFERAGVNQ